MDELMQELNALTLNCSYQKTLALLRALKAGTLSLDNVTMTADGWTVAEVEAPAEPAKVFETVVVAADPPEEVE